MAASPSHGAELRTPVQAEGSTGGADPASIPEQLASALAVLQARIDDAVILVTEAGNHPGLRGAAPGAAWQIWSALRVLAGQRASGQPDKVIGQVDEGAIQPNMLPLVRLLQSLGLTPCDSGDGVSNPEAGMECAEDQPHVHCRCDAASLRDAADHVALGLAIHGVEAHVEAHYSPDDEGGSLLSVYPRSTMLSCSKCGAGVPWIPIHPPGSSQADGPSDPWLCWRCRGEER